MAAFFVPTRFTWRFGGQMVGLLISSAAGLGAPWQRLHICWQDADQHPAASCAEAPWLVPGAPAQHADPSQTAQGQVETRKLPCSAGSPRTPALPCRLPALLRR